MKKIRAKHNDLIKELIDSNEYIILENGHIINKKGKQLGYQINTESVLRNKQYKYMKYKGRLIKIHRIIYAKFKGPLLPGQVIHHIDGNALNNDVSNLEQLSQRENSFYTHNPFAQDSYNHVDNDVEEKVS